MRVTSLLTNLLNADVLQQCGRVVKMQSVDRIIYSSIHLAPLRPMHHLLQASSVMYALPVSKLRTISLLARSHLLGRT